MLSFAVEIIQNILLIKAPVSAEFAASDFSFFGKKINGGKRKAKEVAYFLNCHYSSFFIPLLVYCGFHIFAVAPNRIQKKWPLITATKPHRR